MQVSEAPMAAATAVAQRLRTLRPGLSKRAAQALAEYACGNNPHQLIDITALHTQLAQRFGRAKGLAMDPPPGPAGSGGGARWVTWHAHV